MCDTRFAAQSAIDPAERLSQMFHPWQPSTVRLVIHSNWKEVCRLAHQIHDEENAHFRELDKAARIVAGLSAEGLAAIVKGEIAGSAREAFKLLAKEALK